MSIHGTVQNGVVVLDGQQSIRDGTRVEVIVPEEAPNMAQSLDQWLRRLRGAATDCGVSLSNEALSSEGLYD
jgi:hypothetical protein